MAGKTGRRAGEGGYTLLELMITVAIIGIITPAITFLFTKMTQGMAADEMRNQMVTLNENSLLRIHERVLSSRHMCQGDANGATYQAAVVAGMSAQTLANYPILAGSLLPLTQPSGSFSPASPAIAADFGNSLLFGAYDSPEVLYAAWGGPPKVNYIAPVTIYTSPSLAINYTNGLPATMVIDLYRFYYYYLTAPAAHNRPVTCYKLIEWQSVQYADYNELEGITDATLKTAVLTYLTTAAGFPNSSTIPPYPPPIPANITNAWDPTQGTAAAGFYTVTAGGIAALGAGNAAVIPEAQCLPVTRINSGILSSGYTYGVCPNTISWKNCPLTVPKFNPWPASTAVLFPGGFETGLSGSTLGMELLVRSAIVAKGATPLPITNDSSIISNVRDVW